MATVSYPHIEFAADGTALVEGTRTKVVEIALDRLAHHWDAEEIQRQHPHLTLAQIYAALTYYHDHRQHFDSVSGSRSSTVTCRATFRVWNTCCGTAPGPPLHWSDCP